ncbi:MAG: HAD family phosphatase [Coriobacteriia bacterium]|nr:HAD family phosphatase [Coriobacteriia bacterium]
MGRTDWAPSAVLFDMDGVLLDSEVLARRLWIKKFREYGYELPESTYQLVIGRTMAAAYDVFSERYPDAPLDQMFREQDLEYRAEAAKGKQLKPGVIEALSWLREHGIPTAVGSSTYGDDVEAALQVNGIREYFDVVVAGDQVAHGKPAPDIFLKCAELLGVRPDQCIVIEDSKNGLIAAHAAGMEPVMVPDLLSAADVRASVDFDFAVCDSLSDFIKQLD